MAVNPVDISSSYSERQTLIANRNQIQCPAVIKDLFMDLSIGIEKNRWVAKCIFCSIPVTDVHRTTSNFLKHVKNKHAVMFIDWKNNQSLASVGKDKNQPKIIDLFDKTTDKCESLPEKTNHTVSYSRLDE
jgi:hypothetical protein